MNKTKFLFAILLIVPIAGFSQNADLRNISEKGTKMKMLTIGSSISAGVKNDGLQLSGQKSAYPFLISKQMGLEQYTQALLLPEEQNGTGFTETEAANSYLIKKRFNASGEIESIHGNLSKPLSKVGNDIDDYSLPFLKIIDLIYDHNSGGNPLAERRFMPYFNRLKKDEDKVLLIDLLKSKIESRKPDLFLFELGFQDVLSYVLSGAYGRNLSYLSGSEYYPQEELLSMLAKDSTKGIVATVPNILAFPIFQYYNLESALKSNGIDQIYILNKNRYLRPARSGDIFLPKPGVDSLMNENISLKEKKGILPENPLNDWDIFSEEEQASFQYFGPVIYNETHLKPWAKKHNLGVVDLFVVFDQILQGGYITDDRIPVDPSFPNGNFFSSDGLHPNEFGQAVIANEYIKVINQKYGAKIPLLKTASFLK